MPEADGRGAERELPVRVEGAREPLDARRGPSRFDSLARSSVGTVEARRTRPRRRRASSTRGSGRRRRRPSRRAPRPRPRGSSDPSARVVGLDRDPVHDVGRGRRAARLGQRVRDDLPFLQVEGQLRGPSFEGLLLLRARLRGGRPRSTARRPCGAASPPGGRPTRSRRSRPPSAFPSATSTFTRSTERSGSPCQPSGLWTSTSRSSIPLHHAAVMPPIVRRRPRRSDTFSGDEPPDRPDRQGQRRRDDEGHEQDEQEPDPAEPAALLRRG